MGGTHESCGLGWFGSSRIQHEAKETSPQLRESQTLRGERIIPVENSVLTHSAFTFPGHGSLAIKDVSAAPLKARVAQPRLDFEREETTVLVGPGRALRR